VRPRAGKRRRERVDPGRAQAHEGTARTGSVPGGRSALLRPPRV
jgi:hypothetical protein